MYRSQTAHRWVQPITDAIANIRPTSTTIYLALMAYLALVKLLITFFPAPFRSAAQAGVFAWPFIAVVTVGGLIGLCFARKTGFPDAWDARVSIIQRLLIPALVGVAISVPSVVIDLLTHYTAILSAQHGLT